MGDNSEIFERLSRIEQTLARIDERTARQESEHADHEARIRALERDSDKHKGALAVVGSIGGAIGGGIVWFVKHLIAGGGAQ